MNKLFTLLTEPFGLCGPTRVDESSQLILLETRREFTIFPQILGIKLLPDFRHLFANEEV